MLIPLIILLLLLVNLAVCAYITYRIIFKGLKKSPDPYFFLSHPSSEAYRDSLKLYVDRIISEEHVTLTTASQDGITLSAEYYHRHDGAPLQIMCHGYKSTPFRDFAGGGCHALDKGYNLLLIHHRAHGTSEGKYITFGAREKLDLKTWIDYMNSRETRPSDIILTGLSMGGATVLLASSLPLADNVRCIIADCPYSDTEEILKHQLKKRHLPVRLFYPLIRAAGILIARFDTRKNSPRLAVAAARYPILIIHGEEDKFVPTDMSRHLAKLSPYKITLVTIAGAKHGTSFAVNEEKYINELDTFISKHLIQSKGSE